MKVVVLFERSGVVRRAFQNLGHEAWSIDLADSDDRSPYHIKSDVRPLRGLIAKTADLIIAHPPCTAMAVSGNRYYAGSPERQAAADLIEWVWDLPVDWMAIENPVGQINRYLPHMPRPQYIQPWQFGHPESKKTGLWLRGLPELVPTNVLEAPERGYWDNQTPSGQNKLGPSADRAVIRSRTYEGIAAAMAEQWGGQA